MFPLVFAVPSMGSGGSAGTAATATSTGGEVSAVDLPAPHALRRGLVVGLSLGGGLGGASGYPNDITQIGNPADYSASGWLLGTNETIFVMGALTDYFSFGFWFGHSLYRSRDWRSNGDGGGLRIEAFPLALVCPRWSGLGLMAEFGLGTGDLVSNVPNAPAAGGTQSTASAGAFYEWAFGHVLGGHFAVGPSLEYGAIWSQPFEQHGLVGSLRFVFYQRP